MPGHHVTSFDWGSFGSFCEWQGLRPGRIGSMGEGIGNGLVFLDVVLHFLLQRRKWFDFHTPWTASRYLHALVFTKGMDPF